MFLQDTSSMQKGCGILNEEIFYPSIDCKYCKHDCKYQQGKVDPKYNCCYYFYPQEIRTIDDIPEDQVYAKLAVSMWGSEEERVVNSNNPNKRADGSFIIMLNNVHTPSLYQYFYKKKQEKEEKLKRRKRRSSLIKLVVILAIIFIAVWKFKTTYWWGEYDSYLETEQFVSSDDEISDETFEQGEYIILDSNSRYLEKSDLEGLSQSELRIARNEIFARHGRMFNDSELQDYFDSCSWYNGTILPSDFDDSVLNQYEKANAQLILDYEKECGYM